MSNDNPIHGKFIALTGDQIGDYYWKDEFEDAKEYAQEMIAGMYASDESRVHIFKHVATVKVKKVPYETIDIDQVIFAL